MKNLTHKILVAAVAAVLSTTGAMAYEKEHNVHVGYTMANVGDASVQGAGLGIESKLTWDSGIMLGTDLQFNYGSTDEVVSQNILGMNADIKLGYTLSGVSAYGSFGAAMQQGDEWNDTGIGLGFGGGVSYQAMEHMIVKVEYRTYDMKMQESTAPYDYDTTNIVVGFSW